MLTCMCSWAVLLSTIPVANEAKIPILAAVANTQKANLEDFSHYFIQTQANAMQEAAAAAQFVARHKNWEKVAIAAYDYEWGQTSSKVFNDELRRQDRKSGVWGKSVSVRVELGGGGIMTKK